MDATLKPVDVSFDERKKAEPYESLVRLVTITPNCVNLQIRATGPLRTGMHERGADRNLYATAILDAKQIDSLIVMLTAAKLAL